MRNGLYLNLNINFMSEELKKRLLSFAWRLGAYIVVTALAFTVDSLSGLGAPASVVAVVALIVGEITKWLNKKYQLGKANK